MLTRDEKGTSFRKIQGNGLVTISAIPRKKARTERNYAKKCYKTAKITYKELRACFLPQNALERNSESLLIFFAPPKGILNCDSSAEWFGTEFREFVSILFHGTEFRTFFLFRGMVLNGVLRVCFYLCSTVRISTNFSLPRIGSKQKCESFLFPGTSGTLQQTICFVYSVIPEIIFLPEKSQPYC
jgi:hypothetical protein